MPPLPLLATPLTLTELENQKLKYVVSGDININYLAINNTKISNYFNSLNALSSELFINAPTRFSRHRITETFIKTLNSHAALRLQSRRDRKLNKKLWMNKGILKSIKTKNKLSKSC